MLQATCCPDLSEDWLMLQATCCPDMSEDWLMLQATCCLDLSEDCPLCFAAPPLGSLPSALIASQPLSEKERKSFSTFTATEICFDSYMQTPSAAERLLYMYRYSLYCFHPGKNKSVLRS